MRWTFLPFPVFILASIAATAAAEEGNPDWWKHAVFYQIYPRSFRDSNNDGIGDLRGIIQKIDHFKDAGVDAIWLSPIFRSPQVDQGYDISDYRDVDPDFGTVEDLKELVQEAHEIGIKVILDFVPNHTSDQHPWFVDSENGVEEFRDFYVWADAKVGEDGSRGPPNNWISLFQNSSWTWSEKRQQYYLHQFAAAQPDLNYNNPAVTAAMKDILRFWLDFGVDGFRVDAVPHLFEDEQMKDEPLKESSEEDSEEEEPCSSDDYRCLEHIYTKDQPETFNMVYQWRTLVDEYTKEHGGDERILMTESYTDMQNTMLYFGTADGSQLGAHFTFNFNLITELRKNSTAEDIEAAIRKWLDAIPEMYTSNWVLGNHDNHRVATRFGPGNVDGFNMLMAILPGVGVTYNGEEIGMEDGEVTFEEGRDPSSRDPDTFAKLSRDFERTPYHWDPATNAGFNLGASPWLPVSQKYLETNLEKQKRGRGPSHYKIYQALMKLRKGSEVLREGDVEVKAVSNQVLVVKRSYQSKSVVLVFNNSEEKDTVNIGDLVSEDNTVAVASVDSKRIEGSKIDPHGLGLDAHEAVVITTSS